MTLLTALVLVSGTVDTSILEDSDVGMLLNRAEEVVAAASKEELLDAIGRLSAQAARRESLIAIAASLQDHRPALMSNGGTAIQFSSVDSGSSSSGVLRSHAETKVAHTVPPIPSSDIHQPSAAPLTTPSDVTSPVASNRCAYTAATLPVLHDAPTASPSFTGNLNTPVRAVDAGTAWFTSKLIKSVTRKTSSSAASTPVMVQSMGEPDGSRLLTCPEAEQSYESFVNAELANFSEFFEADVGINDSIRSDGPSEGLLARVSLSAGNFSINPDFNITTELPATPVMTTVPQFANINVEKQSSSIREETLQALASGQKRMTLVTALKFIAQKKSNNVQRQQCLEQLKLRAYTIVATTAKRHVERAISLLKPSLARRAPILLIKSNLLNVRRGKCLGIDEIQEIAKSGEMTDVEEIGSNREESCVLRDVSTNTLTIDDFVWSDTDDEVQPTPAVLIDNIVTEEDEGVPEPVVAVIKSPMPYRVVKKAHTRRNTCAEDIRVRFEQWFEKHWNPEKKSIEPINTQPNFNRARAVAYIKKAKKMKGFVGKVSLAKVKLAEEIIASAKNERVALALGHLQFVGAADNVSNYAKIKYSGADDPEFTSNRKYWKKVRVDHKLSAQLLKQGHSEKELYFSELTVTPTPVRSYARLYRRGLRLPCAIDTINAFDSETGDEGSFLYSPAAPMRKINHNPDALLKFKLFRTVIHSTTSAFTKQVVPLKTAIELLVQGRIVLRRDSKSTVLLRQWALEVIASTNHAWLEVELTRKCGKTVCEEYISYRKSISYISKNFTKNLAIPALTSRFAFFAGIGVPHTEEEEQMLRDWFEAHPVSKCDVKLRLCDAVKVVTKLAPRSLCIHPHWLAVVRSAESLLAKASERKFSIAMCKADHKMQATVFFTEQTPPVLETQNKDRVYMGNNKAAYHAPGNPTMSLAFYQRWLKRKYLVSTIYVSDSSDDETYTNSNEDFEGGTPSELVVHKVTGTAGPVAVSVTRSIVKEASPQVCSNATALPPPLPHEWKNSPHRHSPLRSPPPIMSGQPLSPALLPQPQLHPALVTKLPSQETGSNKIESIKQVRSSYQDSTCVPLSSSDQLSIQASLAANPTESFDACHLLASLEALSESAMADAAAARAERQFLLNEIAFEKDLLGEARKEAEQELEAVRKAFMENRMELKRIAAVTIKEKTHQHSLHAVEIEQKQVEMLYLEAERRPKLTEKYNLRKSVEMKECLLQSELKMQKNLSAQVRQHEKFHNAYKQGTTELTQLRETREIAYEAELAAKDISIQQLQTEIARANADSRANTHLHQNISKSHALLEAEDATASAQLISLQGKFTEQLHRKSRLESQLKQTWKEIYLEREAFASNVVEIAELHEDRHDLNAYFAWKEGQARMATDKSNQEIQDLFDSLKT